jgi:hypothetical protein
VTVPVFFDVYGLFTVSYSVFWSYFINGSLCVISFVSIWVDFFLIERELSQNVGHHCLYRVIQKSLPVFERSYNERNDYRNGTRAKFNV